MIWSTYETTDSQSSTKAWSSTYLITTMTSSMNQTPSYMSTTTLSPKYTSQTSQFLSSYDIPSTSPTRTTLSTLVPSSTTKTTHLATTTTMIKFNETPILIGFTTTIGKNILCTWHNVTKIPMFLGTPSTFFSTKSDAFSSSLFYSTVKTTTIRFTSTKTSSIIKTTMMTIFNETPTFIGLVITTIGKKSSR